jgi:hypothetical protein
MRNLSRAQHGEKDQPHFLEQHMHAAYGGWQPARRFRYAANPIPTNPISSIA